MLAIQHYRFLIGRKIPFSDWPQIVQEFLKQQSLHYERFLYYFQDNYGGLPRALKDCPHMGPIRSYTERNRETYYLSNMEDGTGCTEAEIMALMPKIYRRYGFSETHLIYQDVDFFSRKIPAIVQTPNDRPSCLKGSSITCYRDSVFPRWSSIDLHIIIYDGRDTYDPTPYLEAMKQLLPGISYMGMVECCLSEEEQLAYDLQNADAIPLVENARAYLKSRFPDEENHPFDRLDTPNLPLAAVLKKLCKQYGYTYVKCEYYNYFIRKRTANGHSIMLEADMGPSFKGVGISIDYVGVGFEHRIANTFRYPHDRAELESFLTQCFDALASAEKEVFPALDAHYPPTPDWFLPIV